MKASARVEIARRDGRDVLVDARSEPPIAVRRSNGRVLMVAGAAGPVGGDELEFDVLLGAGARGSIGSVAATSLWPGPHGELSSTRATIHVGPAARLCWWPEPVVSIVGSDHRSSTRVHLAGDAWCTVVEEVSLGRSGQACGTLEIELRVEREGRPLVHHTERFGPHEPGAGSVVGVAGAHHALSGVVVGPDAGEPVTMLGADGQAAWLPIADDTAMILVVATDRPAALRLVAAIRPDASTPSA